MPKPRQLRKKVLKRPFPPLRDHEFYGDRECTFVEMPFSELTRYYAGLVDQSQPEAELAALRTNTRTTAVITELRDKWIAGNTFYGGSSETMLDYIKNGYQTGTFVGEFLPGVVRSREGTALRGRWVWDEQGSEVDVGLALSGDPNCFRSFENRPTLGGLNIVALYSFASSTDHNVIAHYGSWLARLLGTCQMAGISPSLTIDQYGTGMTTRVNLCLVRTRVKDEHDALDWRRYSCLFSPTGYRHLGFAAMTRAATQGTELFGGSLNSGLGQAVSPTNQWDLHWDEATRTATVWSPTFPHEFPESTLTDKLIACGALTPKEVYV